MIDRLAALPPRPFPLKAALASIRMRQAELARLMGKDAHTVNAWATERAAMPRYAQVFVLGLLLLPKTWLDDLRACGDPGDAVRQLVSERLSMTARPPPA